MTYPKIPLAQSIIEICRLKGITNIIISPGSRNAPLTLGFVANAAFQCFSIADERCAAFFALGIAQQTQTPTAIVCTSGSALLNYYPAVAEAFYSQIPLIVLSADRPTNKIDIGDGQTIRQENVFANHTVFNANLDENASQQNDELINSAINFAIEKKGPVHINIPFEEPLYEMTEDLVVHPKVSEPNLIEIENFIDYDFYAKKWNTAKKKLIVVGVDNPNTITDEISSFLAEDDAIVVLIETTSNLHHPKFINTIDTIITPFSEEDFKNWQPDILITFGGMIVSKRVKAFLRKYQAAAHWHIDELRFYDTFGSLTDSIVSKPVDFFQNLMLLAKPIESDYNAIAQELKIYRIQKAKKYLDTIPFSDFKAFQTILQSLPKNIQLQISNSSAIRYAQLFDIEKSIEVFCNRGTSGIDGSTSTAIGAAFVSQKPTVFITGDISFFYDSNALWNSYIPKNFKIILINNGGGGIFRILPGHKETPVFNQFFETSHCLTAEHLAKMFGFTYRIASDLLSLELSLQDFYANNEQPAILEVFTPTLQNDKFLLDFFNHLV
jgi:2-succinyl-5-enolpyruvyl-6-hydroxy-3-cyclohexene-1-carboxylate synthase